MKATEVIERDHRAAEALFTQFNDAGPDEKGDLARKIFKALDTHELMEDNHFYPALKDAAGEDDATLDNIEQEQAELKVEVMGVQAMDFITREHDEHIAKVMEKVLAHAKKEESVIFPKAKELLDEDMLEQLGEEMEPDSAVANS
jgi:hemerythrin superfamily protein